MARKKDDASEEFKMGVGAGKRERSKAEQKRERKAANRAAAREAEENADKVSERTRADAEERQSERERLASRGGSSRAHRHGHKSVRDRHNITLLVVLACVVAFAVFMFVPPAKTITQGLDIQGGLSVIMTASHPDGSAVTNDEMQEAISIVERRVNSLGASEATVQQDGSNSILVQIPGVEDSDTALTTIGRTGTLEFVDLNDISDASEVLAIMRGQTGQTLEPGTYTPFMTGDSITNVTIGQESRGSASYAVNLTLNSEGTQAFADVSTALVSTHGQIAIVLDGVVQSAPAVQSAITGGQVQITGNYTLEEAKSLQTVLESGALPVTLTFSEARTVGPTLGQESLGQAVMAALVGMAIVIVYLLFFYGGLGILTAANLIVFGLIYLGLLAVLSRLGVFALSLAGLAGIVLTIGMAADSSILVLERFREEIRMGKSIKSASISGVRHGIGTSIDGDVVSLVSGIVLFIVAVGAVKGFGLTLVLGILVDILTMFIFKAPIIRLLAPGQITRHPGFWGLSADVAEGVAHGAGVNDESSSKHRRKKHAASDGAAEKGGADRA